MQFDAIVIWGHPLHSHTHSYIHNGFYLAFQHLGYTTYWFDDVPLTGIILPKRTLFFAEHQKVEHIPIEPESYYVLHNGSPTRIAEIPSNHVLYLGTFMYDVESRGPSLDGKWYIRFDGKCLYMPWGTDLLPHEINTNIEKLGNIRPVIPPICAFVGMFLENPWVPCKQECARHGITFTTIGGYNKDNISVAANMKRIQEALIAPALQEPWQLEHGYIPCRIFKNISYGKMGITNNPLVQRLFSNRLIFDTDITTLVRKAIAQTSTPDLSLQRELMEYVRDNHTYLNRIQNMWEAFTLLT